MKRHAFLGLLVIAATLAALPAAAQTFDTLCLTGYGCTAGDVGLHTLTVVQTIDPCSFPGDTATVVFRAAIHNSVGGGSYDIGSTSPPMA